MKWYEIPIDNSIGPQEQSSIIKLFKETYDQQKDQIPDAAMYLRSSLGENGSFFFLVSNEWEQIIEVLFLEYGVRTYSKESLPLIHRIAGNKTLHENL